MKRFDIRRGRELKDGLDMRGQGRNARGSDKMAKEFNLGLSKKAFGRVDMEAIGSKSGKNSVKMHGKDAQHGCD